jgi:primosomal protein N' (replication factor Y)
MSTVNPVEINKTEGILKKYALVVTDVNGLGTKSFTYLIPDELSEKVKYGSPVVVPFGKQNAVNGIVVGFSNTVKGEYKIKKIQDVLSEDIAFSAEYMQLLLWTANYYCCDLNTVIKTFAPSKLFGEYKRYIIKISNDIPPMLKEKHLEILQNLELNIPKLYLMLKRKIKKNDNFSAILADLKKWNLIKVENLPTKKLSTKKQTYIKVITRDCENKNYKRVLEILDINEEYEINNALKIAKTTKKTLLKMQEQNLIELYEKKSYRNPLNIYKNIRHTEFPKLSDEQEIAYKKISEKIDNRETTPILVQGVTGSGKTELYFALIDKVLKEGKNILLLAPEIPLASMLMQKVAERFGTEKTSIWHNMVSAGEKYDIRDRLKDNDIRILVGARSAVFAPIKNLGLIIIDEEHESSYKQQIQDCPPPYYNACEVAEKLAIINNATIVKGSATPDICSFYNAVQSGNLIQLKERYGNIPLSPVTIVDMREEVSNKGQKYFSQYLIDKIKNNLEDKKQTILLMNRLGYTTGAQCKACGEILRCPNCSVPLVYHKQTNTYKCHWCEYQIDIISGIKCSKCGNKDYKRYGIGTERVEEIVSKLFPQAKIARYDSESIKQKKSSHIEIMEKFLHGEIDILIGTSITAKGLDNENVTLVGVINTDSSFMFSDYRSMERGFQLLTQVAGRAGRGKSGGKVIFQSFNPDFSIIQAAKEQNYEKFYREEIRLRKEFDYPPFTQIFRYIISGREEDRVKQALEEISERLRKIITEIGTKNGFCLEVNSVQACEKERVNNEYRYEMIIKNKSEKEGHRIITKFFKTIRIPKDLKLKIDVNPIDMF